MTSLSITVNSQLEVGRLIERFAGGSKHKSLLALSQYFADLASGISSGVVSVGTSATNPVAAFGTWTLASVIATDVANVGGVAFTFTASPSLETDVLVTVPSAKAFASATDISLANGLIIESAHGYATGDVGQLSTSSALPAGFATSTNYYVIRVDAGLYKLASSLANADAGIAIIPTDIGVGNQTFTLTADPWKARSLANAVNAHSTAKKLVTASVVGTAIVTVTANAAGAVGNNIAFTDQDTTITSSGSGTLTGGTGGAEAAAVSYSV